MPKNYEGNREQVAFLPGSGNIATYFWREQFENLFTNMGTYDIFKGTGDQGPLPI